MIEVERIWLVGWSSSPVGRKAFRVAGIGKAELRNKNPGLGPEEPGDDSWGWLSESSMSFRSLLC